MAPLDVRQMVPPFTEKQPECPNSVGQKVVLHSGTDVVLDWNQWSRERRAVWRDKARAAGFPAVLHHVRTPLDAAVERVSKRVGDPWSQRLDEAGVRHLAGIFEPPGPNEGLEIRPVSGS